MSDSRASDPALAQKALEGALARLRRTATKDESWPALTFCTYLLAQQLLAVSPKPVATGDTAVRTLGDPRIEIYYDELGASWNVKLTLIHELAQKRPASRWGQQAFLRMMGYGWVDSCCCAGGSDTFRPMISHGEQYLARFPDSPIAQQVEELVAGAYQTWWDLHLVTGGDYAPDPAQYTEGAEHARQEALRHFERLAKPWSHRVRLTTFLLRHRLFAGAPDYCIYD